MSPHYRYSGEQPTVFISIVKDDETWVPNYGDEIELDEPVLHPLLELIIATEEEDVVVVKTKSSKDVVVKTKSEEEVAAEIETEAEEILVSLIEEQEK